MKRHWMINMLFYVAGISFNIIIFMIIIYFAYTYVIKGFQYGESFSERLTAEKPDKEVVFVLEEDTPVAEAAQMLESLGVIENAYFYRLELMLKDSSTYYRAGTYVLNQNMSSTEVNVALRKQPEKAIVENRITILEGYNLRDIATYLEDRALMSAEAFLAACETYDFPFAFLEDEPGDPNRLEGFLFPDTYFISESPTPDEVIYKMLSRFDEIFTDEYYDRAEALGLTVREVVTMASIIEKEVRRPDERAKVSEVIYNRLDQGIPLGMCSTVLYVLDKKRDRLLLSDLEVDSPYNTYIYPGLPIGPIANPGAECIKAALYPETGDLLYFVLQDDETGEHYFTNSYQAFLDAKERYNQLF